MNRRNFVKSLGAALAGFSILPGATLYKRQWKVSKHGIFIINPAWENAPLELFWMQYPDSSLKGLLAPQHQPFVEYFGKGSVLVSEHFPFRYNSHQDFLDNKPVSPIIEI